MIGLFGTLDMGAQSLQAHQLGIEVTGHNLANVNNPAYARQRVTLTTSSPVSSAVGPEGTGVLALSIEQVRSPLLDHQIQSESSVSGYLEGRQNSLQTLQSVLGQEIDRQASGAAGSAAALGVGGQNGLAEDLADLFNSFQSLSTQPTSLVEREGLLSKAQQMSQRFNQLDQRLGELQSSLDETVQDDVDQANSLLASIADLNNRIVNSEIQDQGPANDLRDLRQSKLEALAKLINYDSAPNPTGAIDISIQGVHVISNIQVTDRLQTYAAGDGTLQIRSEQGQAPLALTGGRIPGTMAARDGEVAGTRKDLNTLAASLIDQVNTIHSTGFDLNGGTGEAFFTGTDAATIQVNATLLQDASRVQASGVAGAAGDNQAALALAQLGDRPVAALGNQTFQQSYSRTVAQTGQALQSVNSQAEDQSLVEQMLKAQRESVSGVSLDEEMTNMMIFQKAFAASARLVSTVDQLLDTVVKM